MGAGDDFDVIGLPHLAGEGDMGGGGGGDYSFTVIFQTWTKLPGGWLV